MKPLAILCGRVPIIAASIVSFVRKILRSPGKTDVGRTTVNVLNMNSNEQLELRMTE